MPYPLPEGDAYTDVLRWFLVAVPDKPEYVRAALGAYTEFTKWYIWERDELKRGADAADAWDEAVAATLEALEMGFPDILLGHIDELEDLLRANQGGACCDDDFAVDQQTDPDGVIQPVGDPVGEDIVVGEGDPPGDVVDWPTYDARLCDGATKFADGLADWFDVLSAVSQLTTIGLAGAIAFLLPVLAGIGLIGASVAGAFGLLTSLSFLDDLRTLLGQGLPFSTEKAEVEDANTKQEVICAIVLASTPAGAASAVQSALNTHAPNAAPYVAWLPLTFIMGRIFNMESDAAAGFGGGCGDCEVPLLDFTYRDIHTKVAGGNMAATETGTHTANFVKTAASGNTGVNGILEVAYTRSDCPGAAYASQIQVDLTFRITGTVDVDGSTGAIDVDFYALADSVCRDTITGSETLLKIVDLETISTPGLGVQINYEESHLWTVAADRNSFIVELRIGTSCQNLDLDFEIAINSITLA